MSIKKIVLGALICVAPALMAQTYMHVPYSMGFEDSESAELANWVLNPGAAAASCEDQWSVGNATHSSGSQALYISNDGGINAQYGSHPDLQYVYRDFYLPAGKYDFSFDWKNIGSVISYFGAGYSNASNLSNMNASSTSAVIPPLIKARLQSNTQALYGSDTWQNAIFTVQSDGINAVRVFFVWSNNNNDSAAITLGACIDNIQLTTQACMRPNNLTANVVSCDEVTVSWTGSSLNYECFYRMVGTEYWHMANQVSVVGTKGSCTLENMMEGSYDIRVRGICTPDTSAWTYLSGLVVYCPELHCVNFTMLEDASRVTCYYSDRWPDQDAYDGYHTNPECAYKHIGIKDFGSDDIRSRHTVNWDPTATDPRTGNALSLVPSGGYASVRLGNWDTDAEAEAISYKFTVDSDYSILLMKYAVVLEDPEHTADEQPRFVLDILDEHGNLIDPTCGHCDFAADASARGWNTYGSGYDMVTWKDWTTIGLHLEDYIGQTLTIRMTTYDCSQAGHYGYAYFTLDCASATIETKACVKDTVADMTLKAPTGFLYQWYDKYGNALPGETKAEFTAPDTATYRCRLTSTEESDCYLDLYSQCIPRLPVPSFVAKYDPKDCSNRVTVTNNSYVVTVHKQDTVLLKDDRCDAFLWETWGTNFPLLTSDRENPVFTYPQDGGTFNIKVTASLNGGCEETLTKRIFLPKIGNYDAGVIDTTICEGEYIQWGDKVISESGTYVVHTQSAAGCDSTATMKVRVAPRQTIILDTVQMCYGEDHYIGEDIYHCTKSGMHMVRYKSANYCDSTVMQYVVVHDPILLELEVTQIDVKAGILLGKIVISGSGFDYYTLNGERKEISELELDNLKAGNYKFVFFNEFGCQRDTAIRISAGCIDALYTRWNNVISLMNKESVSDAVDTVDYEFIDFQWYFNNQPIPGAQLSYYEETDGINGGFKEGEYYLVMTRVKTGERCKTCSLDTRSLKKLSAGKATVVYPTQTHVGKEVYIRVADDASAELYSVLGQHIDSYSLVQGANTIVTPSAPGVYVLNINIRNARETVKLQIQ